MLIYIDTNIFASDTWLSGQGFRLLFQYAQQTQSTIVLLESVELELMAIARRRFAEDVAALSKAVTTASRHGISVAIPDLSSAELSAECFERWKANLYKSILYHGGKREEVPGEIVRETVRRAAERLMPASKDGKETRDVVIWLSILHSLKHEPTTDACFISDNTSDFANSDKRTLHAELKLDVESHLGSFRYFPGLRDFNREHSERISHITNEWALSRFEWSRVESLITHELKGILSVSKFAIEDDEDADDYVPVSFTSTPKVRAFFNEMYVWPLNNDEFELSFDVSVGVSASAECELSRPRARSDDPATLLHQEREFPTRRTLGVHSVGGAQVTAKCIGESIILSDVENLWIDVP